MTKDQANNHNTFLAMKYGKVYDGRARFRLVWSTDLREYRRGSYDIYYGDTDIYLRTDEGVYEVPKYNYCMDRWVLEALVVFPTPPSDLVAESPLAYNPVWVFWDTKTGKLDKDGNYAATEPTLEEIDKLIYYARNKRIRGHAPTEDEMRAKRKAALRDKLDDAVPDSVHALVHGHAVFMDSTKQKKESVPNV